MYRAWHVRHPGFLSPSIRQNEVKASTVRAMRVDSFVTFYHPPPRSLIQQTLFLMLRLLIGLVFLLPMGLSAQETATDATSARDSLRALTLSLSADQVTVKEGDEVRVAIIPEGGTPPYQLSPLGSWPADTYIREQNFVWTPDFGLVARREKTAAFSFGFLVRDAAGQEARKWLSVTVLHQNRPPTLNPTSLYVTIQPSVLIRHTISVTDEDGDAVSFRQSSVYPAGATLSAQGVFSWTATPTQYDRLPMQLPFRISDGESEVEYSLNISKYDAGLPPSITQLTGKREIRENETYTLKVRVYDPDGLPDLSPLGIEGNPPAGFQLTQDDNIYTLVWKPDYTFISADAPVKKQNIAFSLYVIDRNGNRADLPVSFDVLDASDHLSLYSQYRGVMEDAAREITRIQELQSFLARRSATAERSKNRRAVISAVISATTAIVGAATHGSVQVWGAAIGGGLTALLSSLERTTIFPNPTQFNTDSDALISALIDLRVRAATFAVRYNSRDKRTKLEFNTEFADVVRSLQTCRDKVDAIGKKYGTLQTPNLVPFSDTGIRQIIPGFTPDLME